jgi:hypothetical protein
MSGAGPWLPVEADVLTSELLVRQNADGGWGAAPGAPSNTEITALAVAALRAIPETATGSPAHAGARWLLEHQLAGGEWRYHDEGPPTSWPTPIAMLALRGHVDAAAAVERGAAWLLAQEGQSYPLRLRIRDFFTRNKVIELDSTLEGWPWVPGTFSWVEPTSWALLALKAQPSPARDARGRIREAEDMIIDRACDGGGWNYGNRRVLGEELDPYPDTTAIALMGLRGRSGPVVERGFAALDGLLGDHASGLALALALLARRGWQRDAAALAARLEASFAATGFANDNRTLALAALAQAPRIDWLEAPHV